MMEGWGGGVTLSVFQMNNITALKARDVTQVGFEHAI